ncbi:MAG: hypothetical protein RML99_08075 [Anaerolineae bacterium]|nr:hypothetical protein [Anaerolineae bacterium]
MLKPPANNLNRRSFLRAMLIASSGIALAACAPAAPPSSPTSEPAPTIPKATDAEIAGALPPTPACDDDEPTPPQTAGPFYTPNTPRRNSFLEPGISGTRMIVTGYVLDTACRPIPGAMLDFWHCDDAGVYDNFGYKLRGHFFADEAGRYTLETIQPGIYPGRTRHFHVRVQAPNRPVLTTQLYFPGERLNARDALFRPECLMEVRTNADGSKTGFFNFVLKLS